jgi:hypothetical protein
MTIHRSFTGLWYVLDNVGDVAFRGTWDQCCAYANRKG